MNNIFSFLIFMFAFLFMFDVALFTVVNISKIFRTSLKSGKGLKIFRR